MSSRLSYKRLLHRLKQDVVWHDCFSRAAALAFYFQLSIFPLLIFMLSLIGFMPDARQTVLFWLGRLMPAEATDIVERWLQEVLSKRSRGILSFSLLLALWAASTGVGTLIAALNRAYEVNEGRPFWRSKLLALGLTLALCVLVLGGVVLTVFADHLIAAAGSLFGSTVLVNTAWRALQHVTGLLMLALGMALIYYLGPNVSQPWAAIVPGTIFAVGAFILVSYAFSFYVRVAPGYDAVYGSLGAVIILNLWLYLMGLIMYLGGEMNSEIQKLLGKPAPQKAALLGL
jgi:membrane protein